MEGKQKTLIFNLKKTSPPKVRRKDGRLVRAEKMLTSSTQEEKVMVDKLSKVVSSGMTGEHYISLLLVYAI